MFLFDGYEYTPICYINKTFINDWYITLDFQDRTEKDKRRQVCVAKGTEHRTTGSMEGFSSKHKFAVIISFPQTISTPERTNPA
jgi:hypothetical protein